MAHLFLFTPGVWLGEGVVSFSASPEKVRFYTKWLIYEADASNTIVCQQKVELQGTDENVINDVSISNITPAGFSVHLENTLFGKVAGKGIIDDKTIAWEYRNPDVVEGYEVHEFKITGIIYSMGNMHRSIPYDHRRTHLEEGRLENSFAFFGVDASCPQHFVSKVLRAIINFKAPAGNREYTLTSGLQPEMFHLFT